MFKLINIFKIVFYDSNIKDHSISLGELLFPIYKKRLLYYKSKFGISSVNPRLASKNDPTVPISVQ